MSEPAFISATRADIDALLPLIRQYYEFDRILFDERRVRPALDKLLEDPSLGRVYLVRAGSETVGYTILTFDYSLEHGGREVFVDELFIRSEHRGRGYGSRALEFVEGVCRSLGVRAILLGVDRDNLKAQAVYRKFGFGPPDRYMMTKVLGG